MIKQDQLPEDFGRDFVRTAARVLSDSADALGELDRRAGDGDFGTSVRTALSLLEQETQQDEPRTYRQWLTALYRGWLGVGGTSGPLYGVFFRELSKAGGDSDHESVPGIEQFAHALAAGQEIVQRYGEAEVGDKTMIDALDPAVAALRHALGDDPADEANQDQDVQRQQNRDQHAGDPHAGDQRTEDPEVEGQAGQARDAVQALAAAERAAVEGARATAETTARRGRASYMGDAAQGVIDPGAAAMALIIGAARAAAEGSGSDGGHGADGDADVDTSWIG